MKEVKNREEMGRFKPNISREKEEKGILIAMQCLTRSLSDSHPMNWRYSSRIPASVIVTFVGSRPKLENYSFIGLFKQMLRSPGEKSEKQEATGQQEQPISSSSLTLEELQQMDVKSSLELFKDLRILMIKRTNKGSHANQIGFPGGKREGKEIPYETAYREFREELGIKAPLDLYYLGTHFTLTTNFEVKAFVGYLPKSALEEAHINKQEVAELLLLPLDVMVNPRQYGVWGLSERILQDVFSLYTNCFYLSLNFVRVAPISQT